MIRRLKKDVLTELPSKRRQKIVVQCDQKTVNHIFGILKQAKSIKKGILYALISRRGELFSNQEVNIDDEHASKEPGGEDFSERKRRKREPDEEEVHFMAAYVKTGLAKLPGVVEFLETLIDSMSIFITYRPSEVLVLCSSQGGDGRTRRCC